MRFEDPSATSAKAPRRRLVTAGKSITEEDARTQLQQPNGESRGGGRGRSRGRGRGRGGRVATAAAERTSSDASDAAEDSDVEMLEADSAAEEPDPVAVADSESQEDHCVFGEKDFKSGDWVIIKHEGTAFPGRVSKVAEDSLKVAALQKNVGEGWSCQRRRGAMNEYRYDCIARKVKDHNVSLMANGWYKIVAPELEIWSD
jgi:hypothetical protein